MHELERGLQTMGFDERGDVSFKTSYFSGSDNIIATFFTCGDGLVAGGCEEDVGRQQGR